MSKGISGLIGDALNTFVYQPYLLDKTIESKADLQKRLFQQQLGQNRAFMQSPEGQRFRDLLGSIQQAIPNQFQQQPQVVPKSAFIQGQDMLAVPDNSYEAVQAPDFYQRLADRIIGGEVGNYKKAGFQSPYDVPIGYGKFGRSDVPLTQMTKGQVDAFAEQVKKHPENRFPVGGEQLPSGSMGAFQFIPATLDRAWKDAGLTDQDLFTPENQMKAFRAHIQPKVNQYQNGEISKEEFNDWISKQWASVKNAQGVPTYPGQPAPVDVADIIDSEQVVRDSQAQLQQAVTVAQNTPPGIQNADQLLAYAGTGQTPKDVAIQNVQQQVPRTKAATQQLLGKYVRAFANLSVNPNYTASILPGLTSSAINQVGQMDRQIQQQRAGYAKRQDQFDETFTDKQTGIMYGRTGNQVIPITRISPSELPPVRTYQDDETRVTERITPEGDLAVTRGPYYKTTPDVAIDMRRDPASIKLAQLGAEKTFEVAEGIGQQSNSIRLFEKALGDIENLHIGSFGKEYNEYVRKPLAAIGIEGMADASGRAEAYQAMGNKLAQETMARQSAAPYSDKDLDFVIQMNPGLNMTKAGAERLLEVRKRQFKLDIEFMKFVRENYNGLITPEAYLAFQEKIDRERPNKDLIEGAESRSESSTGSTGKTSYEDLMQ